MSSLCALCSEAAIYPSSDGGRCAQHRLDARRLVSDQDVTAFTSLCTQLRLLGASEVSAGGFTAKFEGRVRAVVSTPADGSSKWDEPQPETPLTEEQAREKQYARELGRGAPST